jgi:hypothetical protein
MARRKKQVTLSIDPDVWLRCQRLKEQGGVNWSEVAEMAFLKVLDLVDRAMVIKSATGSMTEVVGDLERSAKADYHESVAVIYELLNQADLQPISKELESVSKK